MAAYEWLDRLSKQYYILYLTSTGQRSEIRHIAGPDLSVAVSMAINMARGLCPKDGWCEWRIQTSGWKVVKRGIVEWKRDRLGLPAKETR